jgi:hypothetical protein
MRRRGAIYRPAPPFVRPFHHTAGLVRLTAPSSADWHAKAPANGDALGNDQYGCCVEAADYQIIRLRRANAWGDTWKPTKDMLLTRYGGETGFDPQTGLPDEGTDTATDH